MALELLQKASTSPLQITEITESEEPKITDEEIDDIIKTYEIVLPRVPKLSREEEQDLFQQLEENPDGDSAREKLIDSNLKLVAHFARIIKNSNYCGILGFGDLFGEGYFGLLRAIEGFDWRLGYKFSTYATWGINQAILRAIKKNGFTIRVPVYIHNKLSKFLRVQSELSQELGREPSFDEVAEKMEISLSEALKLQAALTSKVLFSLNAPLKNGDSQSRCLIDTIVIPSEKDDNDGDLRVLNYTINKILDKLTPRECRVIIMRFGLNGERPHTLEEVGKEFNVTRERIRQIQAKAIRKLRNPKVKKLLRGLEI